MYIKHPGTRSYMDDFFLDSSKTSINFQNIFDGFYCNLFSFPFSNLLNGLFQSLHCWLKERLLLSSLILQSLHTGKLIILCIVHILSLLCLHSQLCVQALFIVNLVFLYNNTHLIQGGKKISHYFPTSTSNCNNSGTVCQNHLKLGVRRPKSPQCNGNSHETFSE